MEKDIDRITKNAETDIVIRIDDFAGKKGVTIREFVKSERYTGFTKAGTRIPADKFHIFKKAINSIDEKDLEGEATSTPNPAYNSQHTSHAPSHSAAQSSFKPDAKKAPIKKAKEESFDEVEF